MMDAATRKKVKGRILTLISKINELKLIGYEDDDVNSVLPCLETYEQELMNAYIECDNG